MNSPQSIQPRLPTLTELFFDASDELGDFREVAAEQLPELYQILLAHDQHMTVTVEAFHHCRVDVHVARVVRQQAFYSRKISLVRRSDNAVVQFGIVRLNLDLLDGPLQREILDQQTPLGRLLIEHNVLRQVELCQLWKIHCGPELASLFAVPPQTVTYGRTALIHCNGEPAIELLEIVAPVET